MTQQMMTHTTDTYDALVALARSLRPRWDVPGIRAGIRAALQRQPQPTLAELAYALVRCAENPTIEFPNVVALDGPHWQAATKEPVEPERTKHCIKCGEFHKPNDCAGPVVIHRSQRPEGAWKAEYLKVKRPSKVIDRAAEAARRVENVELPSEERS